MDCSLPGSSAHGIFHARVLEWCNAGDPGSIPGLGKSPGERIGYPLQYSWASLVAQLVKNLPAMQVPLVAANRGYSLLWCAGFSLWCLLLLLSTGSKPVGSVVGVWGLSCSKACWIFLDQGLNPCPLRCKVDFNHWTTREALRPQFWSGKEYKSLVCQRVWKALW